MINIKNKFEWCLYFKKEISENLRKKILGIPRQGTNLKHSTVKKKSPLARFFFFKRKQTQILKKADPATLKI